ncbi:MAG TPA: SDR family oxidoreductase [Pseudolysinimonas sp.]|nr:SDR family oxidoreductase [Pseudolysinimonas sp.]
MDLGIAGRRAIVAGASAGLGLACARALAAEGVELFMSARGIDRLRDAAASISDETGAKVTPVVADHATEAGRAALLEACPEPDILVITCSPPALVGSFLDIEPAQWHDSWTTAFLGPVELIRAVTPRMMDRGFGRIVNIATLGAKYPLEARLMSGATRAALVNYTVAVGRAVASRNVTINNLLPGVFETPGLSALLAQGAAEPSSGAPVPFGDPPPAGRRGDPDELAALCAVMCSEKGGYLTAQSVAVDGGLSRSTF